MEHWGLILAALEARQFASRLRWLSSALLPPTLSLFECFVSLPTCSKYLPFVVSRLPSNWVRGALHCMGFEIGCISPIRPLASLFCRGCLSRVAVVDCVGGGGFATLAEAAALPV
jgi:hypothetical protein